MNKQRTQINPTCTISWNSLTLQEWQRRFNMIRRAPLLQSYDYAIAASPVLNQKPRWGLIFMDGQEAGLVQLMEVGILKNSLHAVQMDFGPLWFSGYGSPDHWRAFLDHYDTHFPRRIGRRRRILPHLDYSTANKQLFRDMGLPRKSTPPYQTIWLDLAKDDQTLLSDMKGKRRNNIRKAAKNDLHIMWDTHGRDLPWLMNHYIKDRISKQYIGPSPRLIKSMHQAFKPHGNFLMATATKNNDKLAAILIFLHGKSATYQIGWSSDEGKKMNAHSLLIWESCKRLRKAGILDYDLGGINEKSAKNVKKFKEAFGGETVTYLGHYC